MVILKKNKCTSFYITKYFHISSSHWFEPQNVILGELEETVRYFVGIQITEKNVSFLVIVFKRSAIRLLDVKVIVNNYTLWL